MATEKKKGQDDRIAEPPKDEIKDLSARKPHLDEDESVKGGRINMRKQTE
ncbi:MAG: hypothetical protein H7Z74_07875 [Anaerolineae bacterium]|nr:hypothetical protein [Gemmatimonadaceae bacterium]